MGKTGNDRFLFGTGFFDQFLLKQADLSDQAVNRIAQIKPEIQSHLIIAAASGVYPRAFCAEDINKRTFHMHMDILFGYIIDEISGFDLFADIIQFAADRCGR